MEQEILEKLSKQDKKIDDIYKSVEKTRKYFQWTFYLTIAFFVLPLIIMAIILPSVISNITSMYNI